MEGRVNVTVELWRNFYVCAQLFIHRLYFIYASKNYATVEINPCSSGSHCIGPEESI